MSESDTKTVPAAQPETRSVPKYEFFTIIGTIVRMGIALGALLLDNTHRLDSAIAKAAADRRASDAKMDELRRKMDDFRRHMQRLRE